MFTLFSAFVHAAPPSTALPETPSDAHTLIATAVKAAGLESPRALEIQFSFRGTPYRLWLDGKRNVYERTVSGPQGPRVDRLDGNEFTASLGGTPLPLSERDQDGLRQSLNSVAYFALLPRPLQDDAVLPRSLGRSTLEGQDWETLEVRFRKEGGGEDHGDVYRYWIHPETGRLGYLAYTYATGKGGVRLRKALRHHQVDGVVLIDWANHGRPGQGLSLDDAVRDFAARTLPLLSTIELDAPRVARGAPQP